MPIPKEAWQAFGDIMSGETGEKTRSERPDKGKRVRVIGGVKYKGLEGIVFWHGKDRYSYAGRYDGNALQASLREARGKYGFRIGIKTDQGEKFFIAADKVETV